jgi:hypothetical protein
MGTIGYFIILLLVFATSIVFFTIEKQKVDYLRLIFVEKDLPEVKEFNAGKHKLARIKLYGLKKDDNGKFDRKDYHYALIARIINLKWKFELNNKGELDVIIPNFRASENREEYLDIIATCTNFDLRKFVFKGEDKTKLYNIESKIIDAMKEHADSIIDEIFRDLCDKIEEDGLNGNITIE